MSDRARHRAVAPRPPVRVVIADSQAATRAGLRAVLEAAGLVVCAGAGDAAAGMAAALVEVPDVAVVATDLRGGGIALTAEIARRLPSVRIVVLADEIDDDETMLQALRAGASGCLPKATSLSGLARAVVGVTAGEAALSRVAAGRLVQEYCDRAHRRLTVPGRPDARLTAREWDVLEFLRDGVGTSAIGAQLAISPVTVRRHVSAIVHKLGVADRRAAVDLLAAPDGDLDDLDRDAVTG